MFEFKDGIKNSSERRVVEVGLAVKIDKFFIKNELLNENMMMRKTKLRNSGVMHKLEYY